MNLKPTPGSLLASATLLLAGLLGGVLLGQANNLPAQGQDKAAQEKQEKKDADKGHHHDHEAAPVGSAKDRGKLVAGLRAAGLPPVPVHAPDLPKLPWKMVDGAKEFHLVAEHLKREFLPDKHFDVWGFHGPI